MKSLTRKHSETIRKDLQSSPSFRRALFAEAINSMLQGDFETGKSVLREYVEGTMGFVAMGNALGRSPRSVRQMLSHERCLRTRSFIEILVYVQRVEGKVLKVRAVKAAA
jgi:hypothetical protein